ncbi:MAG: Stp1/IreP family PP2C-type Ser/Thr phosphatase [Clostridiaceae bacterium]|nr:Stp1/IreP family PP2C-type Ser/Thr phosphatase [Clostridiaceae bacterium]
MRENLKYSGASHVGHVRANNEDSYFLPDDTGSGYFYCALADGMGGHNRGELASSVAISYVHEKLKSSFGEGNEQQKSTEDLLIETVQKANVKVYLGSLENEDSQGMGTTLTIVVLDSDTIWVAHVGDCRAYLYRDQSLKQLTIDQTVVQEMLDAGSLTPEEINDHPRRNVLTQALGIPEFLQPQIISVPRQKHDKIMLCSDGLYGQVSDDEIKNIIKKVKEPSEACTQLIQLALDNGGEDNVTVLVIST